jgi:hypothetical protein
LAWAGAAKVVVPAASAMLATATAMLVSEKRIVFLLSID